MTVRKRTLCFDPGKTTGFVSYTIDLITGESSVETAQLSWREFCLVVWEADVWKGDEDTEVEIVYESFVISGRTLRVKKYTEPMDVIGVLKLIAEIYGLRITGYTPSQNKFVSDSDLDHWGFSQTLGKHARDAARLLVLHKRNETAFHERTR